MRHCKYGSLHLFPFALQHGIKNQSTRASFDALTDAPAPPILSHTRSPIPHLRALRCKGVSRCSAPPPKILSPICCEFVACELQGARPATTQTQVVIKDRSRHQSVTCELRGARPATPSSASRAPPRPRPPPAHRRPHAPTRRLSGSGTLVQPCNVQDVSDMCAWHTTAR